MGTVYLAEQSEPVQRKVAIKVIATIHHPSRRQRFAADLARLAHPNVASMYDVGTTEKGCPFLVMEPVRGTAITSWSDEHCLDIEARLELFLGVCAGVGHAHGKAILHRDIKPANVLVTEVDGCPVAKVIDFGIARALDQPDRSGTPTTLHGVVGSPAYMSPEAAEQALELARRVGQAHPRTLADAMTNLGNLRWSQERLDEAEKLHRQALAIRERGSDDIEVAMSLNNLGVMLMNRRHLDQAEPVLERAAAVFEQVLGEDYPRLGAALNNLGIVQMRLNRLTEAEVSYRRALDIWETAYGPAHPRTIVVRSNLAALIVNQGEDLDQAEKLRRLNLASLEHSKGTDHPEVARALSGLADLLVLRGDLDRAESAFRRALAIQVPALGPDHKQTVHSRSTLATVAWRQGRLDEAERGQTEVLEIRERTRGPDHSSTARTLYRLGLVLVDQGRDEEAEARFARSLAIRRPTPGETGTAAAADCLEARPKRPFLLRTAIWR